MKPLSQNEVYARKQFDRKVELDQGLKIAKTIDGVRDTLAKEQASLEKFRTETTKVVQNEISELLKKKDSLSFENSVLERQNIDLKKPFDEEWEVIRMSRLNELDERLAYISEHEKFLKENEAILTERDADVSKKEDSVGEKLAQADELMREAASKGQEAQHILNNAKIREAEIESRLDAENNALSKRETEATAREHDIRIREEALKRSVQELVKRERFINDKYATLLRTQKSIK